MTHPYSYDPKNVGKRESSDGVNSITVYAGIGNSDNKLTQREWSMFIEEMREIIARRAEQVYGWWYSNSDAPWQNACVAFLLDVARQDETRAELTALRASYRQDSVAWAVVNRTEFI